MAKSLKETIQLPKTEFPMKANLASREPLFLERWEKADLYGQITRQSADRPKFILHDGPPYANGNIHLGHVMNKTLKDIVIKMKTMRGFDAPYVPGWDCHGMPIEHQVLKNLGPKAKTLPKAELRKECRVYAEKYIGIQREEFKRLGIFGDWNHPYRTMDFSYQAQIAREFGKVVEAGYVFRNRKAIHWCLSCETALAEAEIEYADHKSPSVFVLYPVVEGWDKAGLPNVPKDQRFAMIWTTTPWTLPASMAIAFNEKESYVLISRAGSDARMIVAKALVEPMRIALKLQATDLKIEMEIGPGTKLRNLKASHPFLKREIPFLPGDHVTMESGTGLVHTAPGHGEEDFELGAKFGIDAYSPVRADGTFDDDVEHFAGLQVFKANPKIVEHLKSVGRLFEKEVEVSHSYPHCWRCKNPVIFRATAQWFLSMKHNDLRKKALLEIDRVRWVPEWGRERIHGMISARPDWCLSRQRTWGVPIIAFTCKGCGEILLSPKVINLVADLFEKEGADVWFLKEASELLPKETTCAKCGKGEFEKGKDILDVWFDSGVSHASVVDRRPELRWPADLYLEGSDQHRGWFHSALLEGVATRGKSPYVSVITHGFVVDGNGKKMSKSLGNYIAAQDIVKEKGAEMMRLWVATEDYRNDVRLSKEILDRVVEAYRRIRNTARFCLGNLAGFEPDRDAVPADRMAREMDRWALSRLSDLIRTVGDAYDRYEFHVVVSAINEFCVIGLSSLYLDVAKDILYCDAAAGSRRRSVQTVLFEVAKAMATLLAPILPMTAEEIWDFVPQFKEKSSSVHLAAFSKLKFGLSDEESAKWKRLLEIRSEVSKELEKIRAEKKIGQSLEARVDLRLSSEDFILLKAYEKELASLLIVSRVGLEKSDDGLLSVTTTHIEGTRCERCWSYVEDVKSRREHPLCNRCAEVVETL